MSEVQIARSCESEKTIAKPTAITCTFFVSTHFAVTKRPPHLVALPPLPSSITDKLYFKPSGKEKGYSDHEAFYAQLEAETQHYRNIIINASPDELQQLNEAEASHVARHLNRIGNELWSLWKLAEDEVLNRKIGTEYEASAIQTLAEFKACKEAALIEHDALDEPQSSLLNHLYKSAELQLAIADRRLAAATDLAIKVDSLRGELVKSLAAVETSAQTAKHADKQCSDS